MRHDEWISPIEPCDYDEPHEVGLETETEILFSPYDVPDALRLIHQDGRFSVEFRYLSDEEPWTLLDHDDPDMDVRLGIHSNRIIALDMKNHFPRWEKVRQVIGSIGPPGRSTAMGRWRSRHQNRKMPQVNHYVARAVLKRFWPELEQQQRELLQART